MNTTEREPIDPPRVHALVVYESMFGNTAAIARAIADGLCARLDVEIVEVSKAPTTLGEIDLVVAGGPTHVFGLSRPSTRRSAGEQAPTGLVSSGIGLREWLAPVLDGSGRTLTATFDTRLLRPRLPGSAARAARRRLRRPGFQHVDRPKSFYVTGMTGPLAEGEIERARQWGEQLASSLAAAATAAV
jgi:hypothetical protein